MQIEKRRKERLARKSWKTGLATSEMENFVQVLKQNTSSLIGILINLSYRDADETIIELIKKL